MLAARMHDHDWIRSHATPLFKDRACIIIPEPGPLGRTRTRTRPAGHTPRLAAPHRHAHDRRRLRRPPRHPTLIHAHARQPHGERNPRRMRGRHDPHVPLLPDRNEHRASPRRSLHRTCGRRTMACHPRRSAAPPAPRRQAARTRRHAPARPPTRHGTETGTKPGSDRAIRRSGQAATPGLRPAHAPRLDPVPHRTVPGRVQHHPRIQARPLTGGAMRAVRRTPRTKTKKRRQRKGKREKEQKRKTRYDTIPSAIRKEKRQDTDTQEHTRRTPHHDGNHTTKQHHIKGRDRFSLQKTGFRHGFRARTPGFPLHAGRIPDPQGTMEREGV